MSVLKSSKLILDALAKQVMLLSESDIQKIENSTHELTVRLIEKKAVQSNGTKLPETKKKALLSQLNNCDTRVDGHAVLSDALKVRKELEEFARHLDVQVGKKDKTDQIKDKIIESTVGARLSSNAIQGKNKL